MDTFSLVYDDDTYSCHIQEYEGKAFFHVEVKRKLTLSEVKRGRQDFQLIKDKVVAMGYERLFAVTPSPHFAALFGGKFEVIQQIDFEGQPMEMIVWELKQPC